MHVNTNTIILIILGPMLCGGCAGYKCPVDEHYVNSLSNVFLNYYTVHITL